MFGGLTGISAKEYGARMNAMSSMSAGGGGGHGGRSVPSLPSHVGAGKGQTTTPLCLCDLQRQGDKKKK